jgi:hypothetical protein
LLTSIARLPLMEPVLTIGPEKVAPPATVIPLSPGIGGALLVPVMNSPPPPQPFACAGVDPPAMTAASDVVASSAASPRELIMPLPCRPAGYRCGPATPWSCSRRPESFFVDATLGASRSVVNQTSLATAATSHRRALPATSGRSNELFVVSTLSPISRNPVRYSTDTAP